MNRDVFKIFFLCEDAHSLQRAQALKEKLAENCGAEVGIEAEFYEYARLCHPRLRESAGTDAMAADMIIVSARGTEALPAFVQAWMNEVGTQCPDKIVCAEFLQTASSERAGMFHRFMDHWAAKRGALLFSNLFPSSQFSQLDQTFA